MRQPITLLAACLALAACWQPTAPGPSMAASGQPPASSYNFVRLAAPTASTSWWRAMGINDSNWVIGWASLRPDETCTCHAILWHDSVTIDLGTLPGGDYFSMPSDINDAGQVVGESWTPDFTFHAVLWANGAIQDLGTLHGGNSSATHINSRGQVIGSSDGAASFLWQNGVMQELPLTASAIDNEGRIVGWVTIDSGARHAALWQNGIVTDLGTLDGTESWANGINASGTVVGASRTAAGSVHAVMWANGEIVDLGIPSGDVAAEATAINGRGQVMGRSKSPYGYDFYDHGFVWDNGVLQGLATLGGSGTITEPTELNPAGAIVGTSSPSTATRRAVVWQSGTLVDVGGPPTSAYYNSYGIAINSGGVVAGHTYKTDAGLTSAGLWFPVRGSVAAQQVVMQPAAPAESKGTH